MNTTEVSQALENISEWKLNASFFEAVKKASENHAAGNPNIWVKENSADRTWVATCPEIQPNSKFGEFYENVTDLPKWILAKAGAATFAEGDDVMFSLGHRVNYKARLCRILRVMKIEDLPSSTLESRAVIHYETNLSFISPLFARPPQGIAWVIQSDEQLKAAKATILTSIYAMEVDAWGGSIFVPALDILGNRRKPSFLREIHPDGNGGNFTRIYTDTINGGKVIYTNYWEMINTDEDRERCGVPHDADFDGVAFPY